MVTSTPYTKMSPTTDQDTTTGDGTKSRRRLLICTKSGIEKISLASREAWSVQDQQEIGANQNSGVAHHRCLFTTLLASTRLLDFSAIPIPGPTFTYYYAFV